MTASAAGEQLVVELRPEPPLDGPGRDQRLLLAFHVCAPQVAMHATLCVRRRGSGRRASFGYYFFGGARPRPPAPEHHVRRSRPRRRVVRPAAVARRAGAARHPARAAYVRGFGELGADGVPAQRVGGDAAARPAGRHVRQGALAAARARAALRRHHRLCPAPRLAADARRPGRSRERQAASSRSPSGSSATSSRATVSPPASA